MPGHIQYSEASERRVVARLADGATLRGRYEIVRAIALTRLSVVYLGYDQQREQRVAIKQLSTVALNDEQSRAAERAFGQETRLLRALRHPQIPRLHHDFCDGGARYLVMDYLDGLTLDQLLARKALDLTTALAVAESLCNVVTYLHQQSPSIVHADIKPTNIVLTTAGRVMLIDLGLARVVGQPGAFCGPMGTPPYAPPEQWRADALDQRTDIYALGAVLRELLGSAARSPWFARTLDRASAADRADRFASVAELRQALLGTAGAPPPCDPPRHPPRGGLLGLGRRAAAPRAFWMG